jgi:hypothetical protein
MKIIPDFPDFAPVDLAMKDELADFTTALSDGFCEFPFAAMYLLRNKYQTQVSRLWNNAYALTGVDHRIEKLTGHDRFFQFLGQRLPEIPEVEALFDRFPVWKSLPASIYWQFGDTLAAQGYHLAEDRENFDYLYQRTDLAELKGKKFHKKKNLVNAFVSAYNFEIRPLTPTLASDAFTVLDAWMERREPDEKTDYGECKEALEHMELLGLDGVLVYVEGKPAGFSLGERIAAGTMYCTHFEKGVDTYKGIFQQVNQAAARQLPEPVVYINREQDLGDEGLRQAKMTYRPAGYVVKYLATLDEIT